ncbi:MAG TPA: Uma2 family endonuclease [Terriglobia bacterium]|nr:Uma2 family endonuclease [Terriglobia bacterium]
MPTIQADSDFRLVLDFQNVRLKDEQFFRLCSDNSDLRIEMSAAGELIIMAPCKPMTGRRNAKIAQRLSNWAEQDGTGECFDSSSLFSLPNGAKRSPDSSWILRARWERIPEEERNNAEKFEEICPDFVIELRSLSDRLPDLKEKMEEYMANGARLGWLLDPIDNFAIIYRPGQPPERVETPTILSGESVLPGFNFDFREIL